MAKTTAKASVWIYRVFPYADGKTTLALEVLRGENSALRQGKTYRVYGMDEILRRRREAGYVWTFRNRPAVRLVKMTAIDKPAAVASSSTDPMDKQPAGMENEAASSCGAPLAKIRMILGEDEDATQKLISTCRAADARATEEEILHFLERRMAALRRGPRIDQWVENLLASVPRYFQRPAMELERYRGK